MDESEQAKAYAQADFSVAHESFVDFFEAVFKGLPVGHVLDLGCGSGDVSCRFARRFPKVRLDGIDGSRAMLHWGYKAVAERQLQQRVRLHHGYLPGADFPRRDYDIVISNSLLHHLADPAVLWRLLPMAGRPGARVFVMDLVRPATLEEARRLKQLYSSEEPPILQRDFFNSLLAAYTTREVEEQLCQAGLEQLEVRQVSDRHQIIFGQL